MMSEFLETIHTQSIWVKSLNIQKRPERLLRNYELLTCTEIYSNAYIWEGLYYWSGINFGFSQYKELCLDPTLISLDMCKKDSTSLYSTLKLFNIKPINYK